MSFSNEEMRKALEDIRKEYPSVYKWFFLFQIDKNREKNALRNQTTSGEAG